MGRQYDKKNTERLPAANHTQTAAGLKGLSMPAVPYRQQQNIIALQAKGINLNNTSGPLNAITLQKMEYGHSSGCDCSSCTGNVQQAKPQAHTPTQFKSFSPVVQRYVKNKKENGKATIQDVIKFIENAQLTDVHLNLSTIEERLSTFNDIEDPSITIEEFLKQIGAIRDEEDSKSDDDEDWDPADYAEDPIEYDDISSGEVRKYLRFQSTAKAWMKTDTPQKNGAYICHICNGVIKKNHAVDMDHLPPWKDRLKAFISIKKPTSMDDISGPDMGLLYNMRGSVFAHQYCNRSHKGEDNYKNKWGNAENWFNNDGGSPF